jgi:hypothetical protein
MFKKIGKKLATGKHVEKCPHQQKVISQMQYKNAYDQEQSNTTLILYSAETKLARSKKL